MRILVTGSTGFIGSALTARLKREQHQLDVRPYDVIYHLAAQTSVYSAHNDPRGDMIGNIEKTILLLTKMKAQGNRPFVVLASTSTIAGAHPTLPITELTPDDPLTFYDLSKLTAERYLFQAISEGLVHGCVLRLGNVFGNRTASQSPERGILGLALMRAKEGKAMTLYPHGPAVRDFLYLDDAVEAFVEAAAHQPATNGKLFYIGTGIGTRLIDACGYVATLAGGPPPEMIDPPASHSCIENRNAIIDSTAFSKATGWSPRYSLTQGIRAMIAASRESAAMYDAEWI